VKRREDIQPINISRRHLGNSRRLFLVKIHGALDALLQAGLGDKAKFNSRMAGIESPSRLAVGLRSIPNNFAAVTSGLGYGLDEVANCNLLSRSEVDRLWLSYFSAARRIPSAASLTYKNSLDGFPVPHTMTFLLPSRCASTIFLITAGITCDLAGSKVSPGPYKFTGSK
jgi:hypothetical protein